MCLFRSLSRSGTSLFSSHFSALLFYFSPSLEATVTPPTSQIFLFYLQPLAKQASPYLPQSYSIADPPPATAPRTLVFMALNNHKHIMRETGIKVAQLSNPPAKGHNVSCQPFIDWAVCSLTYQCCTWTLRCQWPELNLNKYGVFRQAEPVFKCYCFMFKELHVFPW